MTTTERFFSKVLKTSDCWIWTAKSGIKGYGQFRIGSRTNNSRKNVLAHRYSYELVKGTIPDGLVIDHICRNRACVNPSHLRAVTPKVNALENVVGSAIFLQRNKTHCKNRHEFNKLNTRLYKGSRVCKVCDRNRKKLHEN